MDRKTDVSFGINTVSTGHSSVLLVSNELRILNVKVRFNVRREVCVVSNSVRYPSP